MPTKRYFSKIKGARYVAADGKTEIIFAHGFADISDLAIQQQLDEMINRPGGSALIFDEKKVPAPLPRVSQNAQTEADIRRGDTIMSNAGNVRTQQEIGHIDPNAGMPSDVNQSTADSGLMSEFQRAQQEARERAAANVNAGAAPSIS